MEQERRNAVLPASQEMIVASLMLFGFTIVEMEKPREDDLPLTALDPNRSYQLGKRLKILEM